MLVLLLTLAVPAEDLPTRLRHLESAAAAWSPAPSPDGTRVAFLTTMFGGRQAASIALEGGYPTQLTDEPGAPPAPLDAAAGDQFPGGFTRDGKKLFYAVRDGAKVSLRSIAMDTRKVSEVVPPPPAAGAQRAVGSLSLEDAFSGLFALGPLSPDGRSIVALVMRSGSEAVVLVDLQSARAELLTPDKAARFRQPRFSPDGRTLYVLTDAGRSALGVDAITVQDRTRRTVYAPGNPIDAFAVSDDGHRLAVAVDSTGLDVFLLLDLPSLRVQPLAAPPAGALAGGIVWDRPGERLLFGWRLADDTTDVWQLRLGRGAPTRLTRSPRPALSRDAIPRPTLVRAGEAQAWLWRPRDLPKPRIAVLISETPTRPVFDKRIAALNFAGLAVLAVNGPGAQRAALAFLKAAEDLDPLLLNPDGLPVEDPSRWSGVVNGPRKAQSGHELDPDDPDLRALVRYVRKGGGSL
jgi:hypothetical protein